MESGEKSLETLESKCCGEDEEERKGIGDEDRHGADLSS